MVKRMVCPKCGMQGKPNDRFCGKCGILLVEKEVEDTNQSTENMNSRANAKARLNETISSKCFLNFCILLLICGFEDLTEEKRKLIRRDMF